MNVYYIYIFPRLLFIQIGKNLAILLMYVVRTHKVTGHTLFLTPESSQNLRLVVSLEAMRYVGGGT